MIKRTQPFKPSNNHWLATPGLFKERITREQLRDLLLNHPDPMIRGRLCKWKHKHLGVGVYELSVEFPKDE